MDTDIEAIERIKKGDKEAYKIIVTRYMRQAYFIALGFVGDPEDALDLSQTAFIKAYKSLSQFDHQKPFFPWFYTILKNLCLNFNKRKKRRPIVPLEIIDESTVTSGYKENIKEAVWEAISKLPDPEREVIILKYFQDLSYKEMAEILDCPIGTIMSRLYYARKRLKEYLRRYFERP